MAGEQPMVGLDYSGNPGASKRPAPSAPTRIAQADVPGGVPTIGARAAGGQVASPAEGFDQMGGALNDIAQQQNMMQQKTWLLNAGTNYELQARQKFDDLQKSAQPGQMLTGDLQAHLTQAADEQTKDIQQPALKAAYTDQLGDINRRMESLAQEYDFKERDRNTEFNLTQANENTARIYNQMGTASDLQSRLPQDIADYTHTVNSLPLDPGTRENLTIKGVSFLATANNYRQMQIDPEGWGREHFLSLPPETQSQMTNVPRGIRNNNPGNLMGTGFNGGTGVDDKGYSTFDTPENGLRAMSIDLRNQQDLHGLNTISGIIGKYAPPGSNDTAAYIKTVSTETGFAPDEKLDMHDPKVIASLQTAMIKHENGAQPYGQQSIQWAANAATNPDQAGAAPVAQRDDGSTRTGNDAYNFMTFEEQQHLTGLYQQIIRQRRSESMMFDGQAQQTLTNFKKLLTDGEVPSDDTIKAADQSVASAIDPKIRAQWQNTLQLLDTQKKALAMTPQEAQGYRSDLQTQADKGAATPEQVQNLDFMDKYIPKMMQSVKTDPVKWYSRSNPVPPVDLGNPESLRQRTVIAGNISQNYGVPMANAFFTKPEANQLSEEFDNASPDQRRVMVQNMALGFGGNAADATAPFAKTNPNLAWAVDRLASSPMPSQDDVDTAMGVIAGDRRMKGDKDAAVPLQKLDAAAAADYSSVFPPGSPAYDKGLQAARALYASKYNATYDAGGGQADQLAPILKSVFGDTTTVNGSKTIVPTGVDKDTFQKFAENITQPQLMAALIQGQASLGKQSGQVSMPKNQDGDFTPGRDKLRLVPLANGVYQMVDKNNKPYAAGDGSGPAILRFNSTDIR